MGLISTPNIADGTVIDANDVNSPINTIVNEINGNISEANLADGAVATNKLADSAVTTAKIADGSITTPKLNNPYIFHAYRGTSTQTLTSNVWTQIQIQTVQFDLNSNFNTSTYKYEVPIDGYYFLAGQIYGQQADGAYVLMQIAKNTTGSNVVGNGGTVLAEARDVYNADSNRVVNASTIAYLTTTDTVSLVGYITDSTTPTANLGLGYTFLTGYLIQEA